MKVWIDGQIMDGEQARIPVLDHGLLYGDGVFEGMRLYNGRVFRLERHLRRLETSARAIHLQLPGGAEAIQKLLFDTLRAHGKQDAYIRLLVTRGDGALGVDPASCPRPRVICIVDQVQLYPEEKLRKGLDLITASVRRPPSGVLEPRVKSLNYLNSVLARVEARRANADEALLLNQSGAVAEVSAANIFVVRDGNLYTPPATDGALEGITRGAVMELAGRLGIAFAERTLGRVDLFDADEVFLTGSGARVARVRSLDGEVIGDPDRRPITEKLMAAFEELTRTTGTAI